MSTTPIKTYFTVFAALMVLTALTVSAAFIDLGPWNTPVALGIAFFKASLVVIFFMHARYGEKIVWVYIACGIYWLAIMMVFTLCDFASRGWTI